LLAGLLPATALLSTLAALLATLVLVSALIVLIHDDILG
jgi:hypothetical protein